MHKIVIHYNYNTYFERYKIETNYYYIFNAMRDILTCSELAFQTFINMIILLSLG